MENYDDKISLQPMQKFLKQDINLLTLINKLDELYNKFTELAMLSSNLQQEPICQDDLDCRYWIGRLKDIFTEMRNDKSENEQIIK